MDKLPADGGFSRMADIRPQSGDFHVDEGLTFETEPPRQLLTLWQSKSPEGRLPKRADFDWSDLQPFFGWMCIAEVLPGRDDLRYRLVGSDIAETVGRDATGMLVSEAMPPQVLTIYRDLIRQPRPLRTYGDVEWRDKEFIRHETLLLPLADNGVDVDQFMLIMSFMK